MPSQGTTRRGCAEFEQTLRLDRRGFLRAGALGAAGLALPQLLRAEEKAARSGAASRVNSVILLWMRGGPSHIDMWDPKPDAPAEYRGEFGTKATKVPGILLGDLLPMCGRI